MEVRIRQVQNTLVVLYYILQYMYSADYVIYIGTVHTLYSTSTRACGKHCTSSSYL